MPGRVTGSVGTRNTKDGSGGAAEGAGDAAEFQSWKHKMGPLMPPALARIDRKYFLTRYVALPLISEITYSALL